MHVINTLDRLDIADFHQYPDLMGEVQLKAIALRTSYNREFFMVGIAKIDQTALMNLACPIVRFSDIQNSPEKYSQLVADTVDGVVSVFDGFGDRAIICDRPMFNLLVL